MNHHSEYNNDIEAAVEVMRRGGVIAYPTDTVWGIGCDGKKFFRKGYLVSADFGL